jgi:HD superfamily phosphohydrolase
MGIVEVRRAIDDWVSEIISTTVAPKIRDFKVIRDPIHDFIRVSPCEVAILDCPVMQRLRRIRQNALCYYVYPGMHHTRFEHSLGVMHVSELMLCALQERHKSNVVTTRVKAVVRFAALLHDIGHVFFSHLGERFLEEEYGKTFRDLETLTIDGIPRAFENVRIGEILSYLIITSAPFSRYFEEALDKNPAADESDLKDIKPTEVGRLVIGKSTSESDQYMADIIHGGMDADKIDYFMRDCHYSGIRAEVDASRLINKLSILSYPGWPNLLTASGIALHHLEQILITKLVLFTSVYHHHKVRATEAAVRTIYMRLKECRGALKHKPLEFAQFTDFLRVDDARFLVWAAEEKGLEGLVQDINNRNLSKRCLVLCRQSVHKSTLQDFLNLLPPSQNNSSIYGSMEQEIYDAIPSEFQAGCDMLVLDFPKFPDADEEAGQIFLQEGRDIEPQALKYLLPTDDWLRSYAVNKYRAHLFYVSDDEKRLAAAQAAEEVLLKRGIKLSPAARQFANI